MIGVAICGYGYWGPNLFRNFAQNNGFNVVAAADRRPDRRAAIQKSYPQVAVYDDAAAAIADPKVDVVVIATPVGTHYELAKRALENGKHVLVEKPMCANASEAAELVAIAERKGLTLMVDHTFIFSSPVRKLYQLMHSGALGHVSYYDSLRVNLGLFQSDVNVLWDLAPHDLSILAHLFGGEEPVHVEASGYCHTDSSLADIAYATLFYASQRVAHLNLSWMSPVKVRRISLGGTKKMVVWDDLDRVEPMRIYDSGIEIQPQSQRSEITMNYRIGDVQIPRLTQEEPLGLLVQHFFDVISGRMRSLIDGRKGLGIVRMLESLQDALDYNMQIANAKNARQMLSENSLIA